MNEQKCESAQSSVNSSKYIPKYIPLIKSTNPFLPYPDIVDTITSPDMAQEEKTEKNINEDEDDKTMKFLSKIIQEHSENDEKTTDAPEKVPEESKLEKESLTFEKLLEENEILKKRLDEEELAKKKVASINDDIENKFKQLEANNLELLNEIEVLKKQKEELDKNLEEKVNENSDLTKHNGRLMKMLEETYDAKPGHDDEALFNETDDGLQSTEHGNSQRKQEDKKLDKNGTVEMLLTDAKLEKDAILKREQDAIMIAKDFEKKNYQLHMLLIEEIKRKQELQLEFDRITMLLERELQSKNNTLGAGSDAMNNNVDWQGELALLQQQLNAYKEDFSIEKKERIKLMSENENLKQDLTKLKENNDHLYRQLQIYEEDFFRERQKRITLLRKYSNNTPTNARMLSPPSPSVHSFPGSSHSSVIGAHSPSLLGAHSLDDQQRYKEYCSLIVEKEQLSDRISELESQGVLRYSGRQNTAGSSVSQQSYQSRQLPPLPLHSPINGATAIIPNSPENWNLTDYYVAGIPPSDSGSSYRGSSSMYSSKTHYSNDFDIAR